MSEFCGIDAGLALAPFRRSTRIGFFEMTLEAFHEGAEDGTASR